MGAKVDSERFQESVDMLAQILKHHEAFLTDWLVRFQEVLKGEVQAVESSDEGHLEEGR